MVHITDDRHAEDSEAHGLGHAPEPCFPGDEGAKRTRKSQRAQSSRCLHTPKHASEALDCGLTTIYALINAGRLKTVYIGRGCRITDDSLQEIAKHGAPLDGKMTVRMARSDRKIGLAQDAPASSIAAE